jgi:2-polyprenyl-3-methyl-5-hydroxy-6-metoxy-1,4-benzoquinol methylase
MKDWKSHWNTFQERIEEQHFLKQVGKTVNKEPIRKELLGEIVQGIISTLKINGDDDILDLCCGNGIITKTVSDYCRTITGIDFSRKLIEIAKRYNGTNNAEYICADVGDLKNALQGKCYDKVFMYEALQYFDYRQFEQLLSNLRFVMKSRFVLYVGSVPDKELKWAFYNTVKRKFFYLWGVLQNSESIGTWWDIQTIRRICDKNNLQVKFMEQKKILHTSHYRFDLYISERNCGAVETFCSQPI